MKDLDSGDEVWKFYASVLDVLYQNVIGYLSSFVVPEEISDDFLVFYNNSCSTCNTQVGCGGAELARYGEGLKQFLVNTTV